MPHVREGLSVTVNTNVGTTVFVNRKQQNETHNHVTKDHIAMRTILSYSTVVLYNRDHEGLGFSAKNYWPKTRVIIPSRRLDSIGYAQSSPDMLSKQPKMLLTSFHESYFFILLTNWCLQTSITIKWLTLWAWFFHSSTWLGSDMCLLVYRKK